ncbi:MAG: glutamate-cysteine ligase family protein [Eggerthellaceae bacterium]|nr:glutamate-cysteine ligase family protein [Eggerthellaceae bacterium]
MDEFKTTDQENIERLVAVFESGCTAKRGRVGIELEHTLVHAYDDSPISYEEERGVKWLLEALAPSYRTREYDAYGNLVSLIRSYETVTLEPGEQVEISAGPFDDLSSAKACLDDFERRLAGAASQGGLRVLSIGYHPTARVREMPTSPKRRYELLASHLDSIGSFGRCMMYGTASTQVSIDYTDEHDCVRKMRLASVISPLLALITDNSPIFEGNARPHALVRTKIWNECDKARCATIPNVTSPLFSWRDYARYVLSAPAVMVYDDAAPGGLRGTDQSAFEVFSDAPMDEKDVELALGLVFPDVRLKSYIEIRPADALPIPYSIAYAALIKGLFSDEASLDALETLIGWPKDTDIWEAKDALIENGYGATVFGKDAGELADALVEIAQSALEEDERPYLEPLAKLISQRITLADMARI